MSEGATLSVCMIVRDESPVLARCLDGVRVFADEIIIVDTGSVDDTKQIARRYTDRVYDFPWIDDFSAARNVSYSYASKDYRYNTYRIKQQQFILISYYNSVDNFCQYFPCLFAYFFYMCYNTAILNVIQT